MSVGLCWLRNDLRLDDNEVLLRAREENDAVVVFYYFDLRLFRRLPEPGFRKTGAHRAAFLLQSLEDLASNLRKAGSELVVRVGNDPATSCAEVCANAGASVAYVQAEVTDEERTDEQAVAAALPTGVPLVRIWGKSLYHADDLPFDADAIPEPFRAFRKPLEKETEVRPPIAAPITLPPASGLSSDPLPTLAELGFSSEEATPAYPGGETAALARLRYYLDESHLLQQYRKTRNRSLGADYSSKFSPYLALGCLSPRRVYAAVKAYGKEHKNYGGNSLLFELRWRDYFLFLGRKHGNRIFRPGGFKDRAHAWSHDRELFENWRLGQTGLPFVDAHMRELLATGFMSNRGRVNCASFLTRDYKIDWRWGAAWFENRLVDYEVCANWLNWHTQALEIYYTSPPWQGLKYDRKGEYVKAWLPELEPLPAPLVHAPWKMDEEGLLEDLDFDLDRDYHRPRVANSKWDWAWGRLKTGDASSPKRKRKAKK